MENGFVNDGYGRFKDGQKEMTPEVIAKKREAIEKKYKQLIAAARPDEKEQIGERMLRELSNLNHEPSAGTLW
jgi:hypothetical protein